MKKTKATLWGRIIGVALQLGITLILIDTIINGDKLYGIGFGIIVYTLGTAFIWAFVGGKVWEVIKDA